MVYSQLTNLKEYVDPDIFKAMGKFLEQVSENMQDGEYPICGDKAFARVMSYQTGVPEECKIEAHNKYIDIQATIVGAEGISVYERRTLDENISYDADKDVVFFSREGAEGIAHTKNIPGYFTMLFPEDAHRPQEKVGGVGAVKKFVIKLAVQ